QDTYLWVRDCDQMIRRVRSCWASLYSVESISYRRRRGFPEAGVAMAVVVQRMVDARTAGVMFTRSATSADRSVVTIEGAWGLGGWGRKQGGTVGFLERSRVSFKPGRPRQSCSKPYGFSEVGGDGACRGGPPPLALHD